MVLAPTHLSLPLGTADWQNNPGGLIAAVRPRIGGTLGALWLLAAIVAALPCAAFAADALDEKLNVFKIVSEAADKICAPSSENSDLHAQVEDLSSRLAKLGVLGLDSGSYSTEAYRGVPFELGSHQTNQIECRMAVAKLLLAKLPTASVSTSGNNSPSITGTQGNITITVPSPTPIPLSDVDRALSSLVDGNIAFNAPDHAIIGKSQAVEGKLSVTLTPSELIAALSGPGKRESAALRVADRMAATLNGGAAFDISPSGAQIQLISHKETTTWIWTITPKQSGHQLLILLLDAIVTVDGKEGNRNVNTLRREINVEVGWPESLNEWIDYGKKSFDGISWLWVTILIPIGVYVRHLWSGKRNTSKAESSKVEVEPDVRKS
jgi:hypothetical protein